MREIKDVVAIMAIKTNAKENVGSLQLFGESEDGLLLNTTKEKEIEVITEEDFEEPKRANFEDTIKSILSGEAEAEENVEIKFLTTLELM
ncbi:hypothetical protein E1312_08100 [Listeria monocytogenes]|nr:hypothetical protein [Listeria monocytogenes]EFM2997701.1 hypothetical protein [Listeria monocytogenes]